jgi:hypothetical protein
MRGRVVAAGQAVVSRALDLTVVPGLPPTLVAVGSIDWVSDSGTTATDWAAAAFNAFDGPLSSAGFGDVVLQAPGQGGLLSVAAGNGWVAVAGTHIDTSTADNSYGNARLMIDAEKRCDLSLSVAAPAELTFRGTAPAALTATITNEGTRACSGTLAASSPYRVDGFTTGMLAPQASVTANAVPVHSGGPRRAEDFMRVSLEAPEDANSTNDAALVHLVFRYCDLALQPVSGGGLIPNEGTRAYEVILRNAGTAACRVRVGSQASYSVDGGKRVSDRVPGSAPAKASPGARVSVPLRVGAEGDVNPRDNESSVTATVVGVGDSDVRGWGSRALSGRASGGRGAKLKPASLRVSRVDVAVVSLGAKSCGWLSSADGRFSTRRPPAGGGCGTPRWLRARGTTRWRFTLRRALPAGRYAVYSRASIGAGFAEAKFSAKDKNRIDFRVR